MISDVVRVAWVAVGRPRPTSATGPGWWCARCGEFDVATSLVRQIVPRSFTSVDGWDCPTRDTLCRACSWAFQAPLLGAVPHLVVRSPEMLTPLTRAELGTLLTRPVGEGEALVVPLQPGRRHLITAATWGGVATDQLVLSWAAADAHLLGVAQQLRSAGVTMPVLMRPDPPRQIAARFSPDTWARFENWRSCPAKMRLAFTTSGPSMRTVTAGRCSSTTTGPVRGMTQ